MRGVDVDVASILSNFILTPPDLIRVHTCMVYNWFVR